MISGRYSLSVGNPRTPAPDGWRWTSLSDIARLESGHTPSRRKPEYWDGNIPWIGIADATSNHGRTIYETFQTVSQAGVDNSSTRLLPEGTVCLSRTASVGFVVEMGRPMCTSQDFVNWVCSEHLNSQFLRYVLLSEHDSMMRFASGTTHQTIYYPEAKAFHVCLPKLSEQTRIAELLGSVDSKIEALENQSENLSDLARAIFKSWFVDFDPVRAKAEGREPEGMDAATAALFPSEFRESVLGAIPAGWSIGRLDDLLVLQRGFDLPHTQRTPGVYPVIAASGPSGTHNEPRVKAPGVVTGRSGVIGKVYWVDDDFWPLNTSLWVKDFKRATPAYAFQLLKLLDLPSYNAGSAVPTLNRNHVHGLPTLLPPANIVRAFDEFATTLYQRIHINRKQSETLIDLRDTLLPRLISGKLRVPEAEKLLEAVL